MVAASSRRPRWTAAALIFGIVAGGLACRDEASRSAQPEPQPKATTPPGPSPAGTAPATGPVATGPLPGGAIPKEWPYPLDAEPVGATNGMVASDSPDATKVGVKILQSGGNAVDAAVAVLFALSVAYPEAGSLGGGGFAVVVPPGGPTAALDFREMAPGRATEDMYLGPDGSTGDRSVTGPLAAGVPGNVMGLWELHKKYGTKPWAELIQPSIELAENGFVIDPRVSKRIANEADRLARFPASAALYLPGGNPLPAGAVLKNPDLAKTLRRIAKDGPDGFYRGETAKLVVAEMKRSGGIMTAEDLAAYKAVWREPVRTTYRDHTIYSMPPPSSGGITIVLLANILAGYPPTEWHSPAHLHRLAEAMKRAFADRNALLADPDFEEVDRETLTALAYAAQQRATIADDRVTPSASIEPGLGRVEHMETTHFSVVDKDGMAVALTSTVNLLFGSCVTVTGAGFLLNDEMDDFTTSDKPNALGLKQGRKNRIAPGKRPLSSMSPTVVVDANGKPLLVTGARGGGYIITGTFQVLSNVLDHGMDVMAAVSAPRIHHQHLPDQLRYEENGLTEAQRSALQELGHELSPYTPVQSVPTILRDGARWTAPPSADPRREGLSAGY